MRRARLAAMIAAALFLLAACQDPEQNPLSRPAPGVWDAGVWDTATWE